MSGSVNVGRRVVPSLLVRDMEETLAFYRLIGFHVAGTHPDREAPTWAEVKRNEVALQFYVESPEGTPEEPVLSGTLYLYPEDVLALADELRDKVDFAWGPQVMDYGMRELAVRDPNGYVLAFTEPV